MTNEKNEAEKEKIKIAEKIANKSRLKQKDVNSFDKNIKRAMTRKFLR